MVHARGPKIDVEGRTLLQPDNGYSVNVAGFYLHAPVHIARPDVQCIIHTHTRADTATGALDDWNGRRCCASSTVLIRDGGTSMKVHQ